MSSTTATQTTQPPSQTSTAACAANLYNIPVRDAACAMPYGDNHTAVMQSCCGPADVVSYGPDCGLYCLSLGQSIADLTTCLYAHGAAYQQVFCRGNSSATATGSGAGAVVGATSGVSVVASGTAAAAASGGGSGSSKSSSAAGAPGRPSGGVGTTLGLAIGALLFSAAALGAAQL